jgi:hypothetical protein
MLSWDGSRGRLTTAPRAEPEGRLPRSVRATHRPLNDANELPVLAEGTKCGCQAAMSPLGWAETGAEMAVTAASETGDSYLFALRDTQSAMRNALRHVSM